MKAQRNIKNFHNWSSKCLGQDSLENSFIVKDLVFSLDDAMFLNACNIPWSKANSNSFKSFFSKIGKKVPEQSTLRLQLPKLYESALVSIRQNIGDSWIYMQVDEARIADRAIVSVLVGRLDGKASDSYCINIVEVDHRIVQIVNNSLCVLWPQNNFYERFRLLVSDQASYMIKAGKDLKCFYPELIHVTCLCHALHRVSEQVHSDKVQLKKFVEKFGKVLSRSKRRQNKLSFAIGAALHPLPIITRWGTWLSFCEFLHKHFDKIIEFISRIEEEDNCAISTLIQLSKDKNLREQLLEIHQLQFIVKSIKQLEEHGLTVYRQRQLVLEAKEQLPYIYQKKLESSLSKNPGYEVIFKMDSHEKESNFAFAPLCSVDVECSFSPSKVYG